ncbi:hypothetical protein BH09PLA1_BH09PLA1_31020 [soil metagenome]
MVQAVENKKAMGLSMSVDKRAGDQVLTVRGLSKSFGENHLWTEVNFDVRRGERIGIIGPNGSGKTTMLRALLGEEQVDAGTLKWGASLKLGYYDQRLDEFDPESTILEEVRKGRPDEKDQVLRDTLGTMLFREDDVHKEMSLLSGGERARVALAELLLDKPNVILLDEPTNHLDIPSREALESALKNYDGTIMCVSHDRFFLEQIVERLLVLEPPNVVSFSGTYHDWVARQKQPKQTTAAKKVEPKKPEPQQIAKRPVDAARDGQATKGNKKQNPYARPFGRLTMKELEREINDTETAIANHQSQFGDAGAMKDQSHARKLQNDYQSLTKKLKTLEAEYFAREK